MKNTLTIVLLLFVAISVVYLAVGERSSTSDNSGASPAAAGNPPTVTPAPVETNVIAPSAGQEAPALMAYYFHGNFRCPTCLTIERFAREAIESEFDSELRDGLIRWQAINYDEPSNEHFVKQYELYASALVLVPGQSAAQPPWQKLDRVWDLVGDESAFKTYVIEQARAMLRDQT